LFLQTQADLAFFGEKDLQQVHVVKRMAKDLDIPIEIVPCATVRETDGLAMSSRNMRLSPADRVTAPKLAQALRAAASRLRAGEAAEPVLRDATKAIEESGFARVEYLELRAEADLKPLARASAPARFLVAAWLGDVRLIDNVEVTAAPR
jgi:pantoate--beta-alanine ligase